MPKFIAMINVGYGEEYEIIEADNEDEAREVNYQRWLDECENNHDRQVYPYTKEKAFDVGLEDEE